MLISPHSSSPRWIGSNSGHYSSGMIKRKRSSVSSQEEDHLETEKEGMESSYCAGHHKKSRRDDRNPFLSSSPSTPNSDQHQLRPQTHVSTPTPVRHLPPLIPSKFDTSNQNTWGILNKHNHKFNPNNKKPPTIDEVRHWTNSSSSTTSFSSPGERSNSNSSFSTSSPSRWTKVETSYGHRMVDLEEQSGALKGGLDGDEEMNLDEGPSTSNLTPSENEIEFHQMGSDSTMHMQLLQEEETTTTTSSSMSSSSTIQSIRNGGYGENGLVSSPPETYMVEGMANAQGFSHSISPTNFNSGISPFPCHQTPVPYLSLQMSGKTGHPHPYGWNAAA